MAPNPWTTIVKLIGALLAAGILTAGLVLPYVGGLGLAAGHVSGKFLNASCTLQESRPPQKTTMYARDGKTVIATLFSQDRVPIPLTDIPKALQEALVATEDRRFYQHHGVDLRGLIRSAISTSSGDTQGGSTLTMQYVKQVRYYQAGTDKAKQQAAIDQNLQRKIEDAKCALYIENSLHESKNTILDNYLNIAFFGEHSYGVQTAAETYFNKPASQLSLSESALLVGLLRAPSAYDPFLNRAQAKQRRDEVLQNLVNVGKLSQATADKVAATPVALATQTPPVVRQGCANAGSRIQNAAFFCEYAQNWLESVDSISPTELETGGLKIITTLDPTLQNSSQKRISKAVPASSPMTAVLPAIDPHTGDILAMATSKPYGAAKNETEQPVFTAYTASGASTFKLFPLLAALQTGIPRNWVLQTVGNVGEYQTINCATESKHVSNGDANVFYNPLETLETATAKSSNTYFVALADKLLNCHLDPIVSLMQKLGMKSLDQHDPADNPKLTVAQNVVNSQRAQQLVLGSIATSPLELAGAYAAIANGGKYNEPAPILAITDSNGNSLPVKRAAAVQVVAPQVAAQAVQILSLDTKPPGTSASAFNSWYTGPNQSVIAGKTGTNESNRKNMNASVWFVGMTPGLVAASGLINFDHSTDPSSGLPGVGKGQAYGDYASEVWLKALAPTLVRTTWSWQDPFTIRGTDVPNLVGMTTSDAKRLLSSLNLKMDILGAADHLECPSSAAFGTIGYYAPQRATSGSTITVCPSSGIAQYTPPPPVKVKVKKPTPGRSPHPGGGSNSPSPPAGSGHNRPGPPGGSRGAGGG